MKTSKLSIFLKKINLVLAALFFLTACNENASHTAINRKELVRRHNITFTGIDEANIPQVGNGEIAFGIDITGLQTLYGNTMSQWGWHSFIQFFVCTFRPLG